MHVLVVDDNPANTELLRALLDDHGMQSVTTETDSRLVAALLPKIRPDIVLLDLRMPHVDGFELIDVIATYAGATYLPVLVLTADTATGARNQALAHGAHDYLTKPFDTVEVSLRIANLLETRRFYSDLARQARMLAQQRFEVQREHTASQRKSDFLANMSHEIRTPMNGVLGLTDLLLETALDDRQRDYARTVRSSAQALLTIIDDILDFSKVEAGMQRLEEVVFDLRVVLDDVVGLLVGPALAKGVELAASVAGDVPSLVLGDPGRVRQVLTNLVGNAVKFTHTGTIMVRIAVASTSGDRYALRFEVCDTGDGIAAAKLDGIFDPFEQADTSTSRRYGGTGLGLAISRELVALMRGSSGVTSQFGVGSTFWFTITLRSMRTPSRPAELHPLVDPTVTPPAGAPPVWPSGLGHLLVVDDNAINRKVAVAMLTAAGYRVDTAADGSEAVDAVGAHHYDAVLMDCQMPILSGYEATAAIREIEGSERHTPIIAMTAGARREDRERCFAEGMDNYVSKPVTKAVLLEMVGQTLAASRQSA